ncbi:hypothetical protein WJX74_003017 [Apatococcus lobatus]|uniref:Protein NLRC3 n=1 Tax=Apatococcus lobatus TaxID=904363 RepID=A0AAW1QMU2_9CHLO
MELPGLRSGRHARRGRHYANLVGADVLSGEHTLRVVPEIDWKKVRKKGWQTRLEEEAVATSVDLQQEVLANDLGGWGALPRPEDQTSYLDAAADPPKLEGASLPGDVPRQPLQTVQSFGLQTRASGVPGSARSTPQSAQGTAHNGANSATSLLRSAASSKLADSKGDSEPETWDLNAGNLAQTVLGLPAFNPTPAQQRRMAEINARMLNVPNLFCATADQKGVMLSLQSLQDAINLRKWGKNDMMLAKRRLHQFAHAPMNWADVRRAVQIRKPTRSQLFTGDMGQLTLTSPRGLGQATQVRSPTRPRRTSLLLNDAKFKSADSKGLVRLPMQDEPLRHDFQQALCQLQPRLPPLTAPPAITALLSDPLEFDNAATPAGGTGGRSRSMSPEDAQQALQAATQAASDSPRLISSLRTPPGGRRGSRSRRASARATPPKHVRMLDGSSCDVPTGTSVSFRSPGTSFRPGLAEADPTALETQASEEEMNKWMPSWAHIFEEASRGFDGEEDVEAAPLARLRSDWQAALVEENGVNLYKERCKTLGIVALSEVIAVLGKESADLSHCYMGALGVHAFAHALACNTIIEELLLRTNGLTDQGLGYIVRALLVAWGNHLPPELLLQDDEETGKQGGRLASLKAASQHSPHASTMLLERQHQAFVADEDGGACGAVNSLTVADNPLTAKGIQEVLYLFDPDIAKHQQLRVLCLEKCGVSDALGVAVAEALVHSLGTLQELSLSQNGLKSRAAQALGALLRTTRSLTHLDLSWNEIKAPGMKHLAGGMLSNRTLKGLSMAWNGLCDEGCFHMADMVAGNAWLEDLDVSHVQMGTAGCIVFSEALRGNTSLKCVLLNGNPLGEAGGWHIMDAVISGSAMPYIRLAGANFFAAGMDQAGKSPITTFIPASPQGYYTLQLEERAQRAIAIMLCQADQASAEDLIRGIMVNGRPAGGTVKRLKWPDRLPNKGRLTLEFTRPKGRHKTLMLNDGKLAAFMPNLRLEHTSNMEKLLLVQLFLTSQLLTESQAKIILQSFSEGEEKLQAALIIFTRLDSNFQLEGLSQRESKRLGGRLGVLGAFRADNPTGHYELSLSSLLERMMARRLADLALSEGDALTWRAIAWEHDWLHSSPGIPSAWHGRIPDKGLLYLDFISGDRPALGKAPLSDAELQGKLRSRNVLGSSLKGQAGWPALPGPQAGTTQLCNLRAMSPDLIVTAEQVKCMLAGIRPGADRVEVVVSLFCRLTDPENLWTIIYSLKGLEQSSVMNRLGLKATFNLKRCSHHFLLDWGNPEHLEVGKKLNELALKMMDVKTWHNTRVFGKKKAMVENTGMMAVLTTESFTPIIEMDILGPDSYEPLGLSEDRFQQMSVAERLDALNRYGSRMENTRLKQMHHYYAGGVGGAGLLQFTPRGTALRPVSSQAINLTSLGSMGDLQAGAMHKATLVHQASTAFEQNGQKPPWTVQWDRTMRQNVALEGRSASPLVDIFLRYTSPGCDRLSLQQLKEAMVAHGHAKAEAQHAEQLARTLVEFRPTDQPAGNPGPAAPQPMDPSRPGYGSLPLLTYDDFEHIWMSASLTGPSLARH